MSHTFACPYCGEVFTTVANTLAHMSLEHTDPEIGILASIVLDHAPEVGHDAAIAEAKRLIRERNCSTPDVCPEATSSHDLCPSCRSVFVCSVCKKEHMSASLARSCEREHWGLLDYDPSD